MLSRLSASAGAAAKSAAVRRSLSSSTAAASEMHLKFLIVDGYAKAGREDLKNYDVATGGDLYVKMLDACSRACGVSAESEIVYPADPDFAFTADDIQRYDAIAWTGSSLTIYHDTDEVQNQIKLGQAVLKSGVPSFGSCWYLQLMNVALGGRCAKSPRGREFFLSRKVQLTPDGRSHPMFEGKPAVFSAFTSHDDELTHLPAGGQLLAGNPYCSVQAASFTTQHGDTWGVQYHPEYSLYDMARLLAAREQKLIDVGYFRSAADVANMVEELTTLHGDPSRKDLAWKYGLDADVLSESIRFCEPRNWVSKRVIPRKLLQ